MGERAEENPWLRTRTRTGAEYDAPFLERAAAGINVHGEADLLCHVLPELQPRDAAREPYALLDAGCGTGRIAIELARRGWSTVGVDLDAVMLAQARARAPELAWHLGDLAAVALDQRFDAVLMAGNVMIYVTPGSEAAVLANMARHLRPGGLIVAGFRQPAPDWSHMTPALYDQLAAAAGLALVARWGTWDRTPWQPGEYTVSVHQSAA